MDLDEFDHQVEEQNLHTESLRSREANLHEERRTQQREAAEVAAGVFRTRLTHYHNRLAMASTCHLLPKSGIADYSEQSLRIPMTNIFAHNKPRKRGEQDAKGYLHGRYACMFDYMHQLSCTAGQTTSLDEMVPYSAPMKLFFDIELKQGSVGDTGALGRAAFVTKHDEMFFDLATAAHAFASRWVNMPLLQKPTRYRSTCLLNAYFDEFWLPFTEEICVAGARVVLEHLKLGVETLIGGKVREGDCPWDDIYVTSGCRAGKFSLHVVFGRIFCERNHLSAPCIVHEFARQWSMFNLVTLLWTDGDRFWETPEGRFRLRCLMADDLTTATGRFKARNDTLFDEGVYDMKHLLRLPGSPKSDGRFALHPLDIPQDARDFAVGEGLGNATVMITEQNDFAAWFPNTDAGLAKWLNHTIHGYNTLPGAGSQSGPPLYVFTEWCPTDSFVPDRAWRARKAGRLRLGCNPTRSILERSGFVIVVPGAVVRYTLARCNEEPCGGGVATTPIPPLLRLHLLRIISKTPYPSHAYPPSLSAEDVRRVPEDREGAPDAGGRGETWQRC